jgi:hypothetical protein
MLRIARVSYLLAAAILSASQAVQSRPEATRPVTLPAEEWKTIEALLEFPTRTLKIAERAAYQNLGTGNVWVRVLSQPSERAADYERYFDVRCDKKINRWACQAPRDLMRISNLSDPVILDSQLASADVVAIASSLMASGTGSSWRTGSLAKPLQLRRVRKSGAGYLVTVATDGSSCFWDITLNPESSGELGLGPVSPFQYCH